MRLFLKTMSCPLVFACFYSAVFTLLCGRMPDIWQIGFVLFIAWSLLLLFADRLIRFIFRIEAVSEEEAPELYSIVEGLSSIAGIKTPKIFIIPSASGHIFSARSLISGSVAVSQGAFQVLNREEMTGVLAQAMVRIKKKETVCAAMAAMTGGLILIPFLKLLRKEKNGVIGTWNIYSILSFPIMTAVHLLIRCSFSHRDTFDADKAGAVLCGDPLYLASGLDKLANLTRQYRLRKMNPALHALLLFSEIPAFPAGFPFQPIHPELEDRISRLDSMARAESLLRT